MPSFARVAVLSCSHLAAVPFARAADPWGIYGTPLGPETGCLMHKLAFEKALVTLPDMLPPGSLRRRQVWDALVTGDMTQAGMGNCSGTTATPPAGRAKPRPPSFEVSAATSVFVDAAAGSDAAPGTHAAPVKTVAQALALTRERRKPSPGATVVLRAGVHHLSAPLQLGPQDSGLTLQNFPGEEAWISGATPLRGLRWTAWADAPAGSNIWKAVLPAGLGKVWGIHELSDPTDQSIWQVVKTRARFPNRESPDAREDSWADIGKNATWQSKQPVVDRGTQIVVNATPFIPKTVTAFPDYYMYGAGGACAAQGYDPPGGWLCADYGGMHGGTWTQGTGWSGGYPTPFPASLALSNTTGVKQSVFPHSSHWDVFGGGGKAGNGTKAMLRAWVNGWFTSMWEIAGWDEGESKLTLGRGGFHGGQPVYLSGMLKDGTWGGEAFGFDDNTLNATNRINPGDMNRVFVENLLAELDQAEEYWIDELTNELYFAYNGTGSPPPSLQLAAVTLQNLLAIRGEDVGPSGLPTEAARDITVRGIGFRDAGYTYMNPHGNPGGGDWALQSPQYDESGAIYLSGTQNVRFEQCTFKYLDGNGVYLAGYNRNATVTKSELTHIGDSAIALWGYTRGAHPAQPPGTGIDGSDGNQPRGTVVSESLCHEYGFFQKQSSCVHMGKSMETTIVSNVFFNGPRAHVNQNDAFGGGSLMARNVMWSSCRESSDHGVFNSWNRQPFIWEALPGELPNLTPKPFVIEENFFISNYGSGYGVDNDDGSAYFDIRDNVFYEGSGLKSDYAGHDKLFHGNLGIGMSLPCGVDTQYRIGHEDQCFNNTLVLRTGNWRAYLPFHNSTQPADSPWVQSWFCDVGQQKPPRCGVLGSEAEGGPSQLAKIYDNTVFNFNVSTGDVQCGQTLLTRAEFKAKCGVDVGTSSAVRPSDVEIEAMVRRWILPSPTGSDQIRFV